MHRLANHADVSETRASIVIAEDECVIRTAVADELAAAGFAVLQAGSAEEVVAILESGQRVDLVFSDIHMPGTLGMVGLLTVIQERFPGVSVILTSGRFRAPPAGFDCQTAFIPKPYILKVVVDLIVRAVGQKGGIPSGPA